MTDGLDPILASKLEQPDGSTLKVTLQNGTRSQDGKPLTSKDVLYSFELAKRQNVSYTAFWDYVSSMTINDAKTLTIKLNTKKLNIGLVKQNLTYTAILPQHIWAGLEKSEKSLIGYSNMKPVGFAWRFNPNVSVYACNWCGFGAIPIWWCREIITTPAKNIN